MRYLLVIFLLVYLSSAIAQPTKWNVNLRARTLCYLSQGNYDFRYKNTRNGNKRELEFALIYKDIFTNHDTAYRTKLDNRFSTAVDYFVLKPNFHSFLKYTVGFYQILEAENKTRHQTWVHCIVDSLSPKEATLEELFVTFGLILPFELQVTGAGDQLTVDLWPKKDRIVKLENDEDYLQIFCYAIDSWIVDGTMSLITLNKLDVQGGKVLTAYSYLPHSKKYKKSLSEFLHFKGWLQD